MKTAHDIILKPVITENSMAGIADKKYTFKVATDATKVEIAQAVEVLFPGVKVSKVNTISVRGRFRRQGMHPPPGHACWLHCRFQEGNRDPDQGLQGNRVLQQHGLNRTRRGFLYGDMTPIIIHKINKGE